MDFFARQDHARAQTRRLVVLFALAVTVVVVAVTAALTLVLAGSSIQMGAAEDPGAWFARNAPLVAGCALVVLAIVLVGAAVKSMQLQGGGAVVARAMGGDLVDANTRDPLKKRLLNIVEEMAIASGVPVPAVYVLEGERGINAFAAGHTPADTVIAVTRGALERFDRAEMQGVIGHEFSHVLNGDVRIDMRLLAMVAGLFAIATVGRVLMRGGSGRRKGGGIALAGLAMFALGWIGIACGRAIQAAISRQREYLADASSVQFTRDPQGLRDALVKVGASGMGSRLAAHGTGEVAHMLFASGTNEVFATHPPLVDRIRALDPAFDPGEFTRMAERFRAEAAAKPAAPPTRPAPATFGGHPVLEAAVATAVLASQPVSASVARPRGPHVRYAERLNAATPPALEAEAADPSGARVLLAALLGGGGEDGTPAPAGALAAAFGPEVAARAAKRAPAIAALPREQRLPLLLRLLPALGRLPLAERRELLAAVDRMVRADGTITLHEYALARLARVHLGDQITHEGGTGGATLLQAEPALQRVFATLARLGHDDEAAAREACERGLTRALPGRPTPYAPPGDWVGAMDADLDRLDALRPAEKQRLVDALATLVASDGRLDLGEAELLRAICGSVHCPLPPLVGAEGDGPTPIA